MTFQAKEIYGIEELSVKFINKQFFLITIVAGVPEWSNGIASRAIGLVPTQVRSLSPAVLFSKQVLHNYLYSTLYFTHEPATMKIRLTKAFCISKRFAFSNPLSRAQSIFM